MLQCRCECVHYVDMNAYANKLRGERKYIGIPVGRACQGDYKDLCVV